MNCREARLLIETDVLADLPAEKSRALRLHADSCPKCAKRLATALRSDAALTMGLMDPSIMVAPSLTRTREHLGAGPKWILAAASLAGAGVVGYMLGERGETIPLPVTNAHAAVSFLEPFEQVQGIPFPGFELGSQADEGFESMGNDWKISSFEPVDMDVKLFGLNYEFDSTLKRKGNSSLKLFHRYGGATASFHLPVPIPAGSKVVSTAWIYSPKGGSRQNKWLSVGLAFQNGEAPISSEAIAPTHDWNQISITTASNRDSLGGVSAQFSTGSGNGKTEEGRRYLARDWASWIDDVQLSVIITPDPDSCSTTVVGDRIVVSFPIPTPYTPKDLDLDGLQLVDASHSSYPPIPVTAHSVVGSRVQVEFRSWIAANRLRGPDPDDPGGYAVAQVQGFIKWGPKYRMPFHVGVDGTLKRN